MNEANSMFDFKAAMLSPTQSNQGPRTQSGRLMGDDALLVEFYVSPVEIPAKMLESGVPYFEEREHIRITTPGIHPSVWEGEVKQKHKDRFPYDYQRFSQNRSAPLQGFPLEEWPIITRSIVLQLAHLNIRTVEQLASVSDSVLDQIGMGARGWQVKAKEYMTKAHEEAPFEKLAEENKNLNSLVESLQAQISALEVRFGTSEEKKKR